MVTLTTKPTREQIARVVDNDQRMIAAFEAIFNATIVELPDEVLQLAGRADLSAMGLASVRARGNDVRADYIDFPANGPHVTLPRRVQWNEGDGTIDVGLLNGVVLQVGQEMHYYAKNTSGATILDGQAVMATGTVGASGKITIAKAVSDGSVDGMFMIGVATQDIADNDFGYVTSFGLVRGIDTSAFTDGDILYFDPATPGALTDVRPSAPNLRTAQAIVINAGPGGSGSIFVRMHPDVRLDDLNDVDLTGLADGDLLQWDAVAGVWVPYTLTGASGSFTAGSGETITVTNGLITGIV